YGAFGFGYIIPATFLPAMAKQVIRDPLVFGWSWPLFGAAAMGSTLATAMLRSLVSNRRLWVASHLVMALGIALPIVWSGIVSIMLAALFVGGTFMVATMTGLQEAREVGGVRATGLMAALTSAFALGQIAGPISVSLVVGAGGNFAAALAIACPAVAASGYALPRRTLSARERRLHARLCDRISASHRPEGLRRLSQGRVRVVRAVRGQADRRGRALRGPGGHGESAVRRRRRVRESRDRPALVRLAR